MNWDYIEHRSLEAYFRGVDELRSAMVAAVASMYRYERNRNGQSVHDGGMSFTVDPDGSVFVQ